jgi:hypothetical protein
MMNLKNIKRPNFPFLYYRLFFFLLKTDNIICDHEKENNHTIIGYSFY